MKPWLFSFLFLLLFASSSHAAIWYVNQAATGANDGTSWFNAFTDLQDAIAVSNFGDEIWVASGTYKPTTTTDRSISFRPHNGTRIYGGFNGTELVLTARNPAVNITILSGNIGAVVVTDNSYNVVVFSNCGTQTRLDGVTVTGGYDVQSLASGAGVWISSSSPVIENCIFAGNHCAPGINGVGGSAIGGDTYIVSRCQFYSNTGSPVIVEALSGTSSITDCYFANTGWCIDASGDLYIDRCIFAGINGRAVRLEYGDFYLSNSLFIGNRTAELIWCYGAQYIQSIVNCTFAHNTLVTGGNYDTLIVLPGTNSELKNCIIWGNTAGHQLYCNGSVSNAIIQGGYPAGVSIINQDPLFIAPGVLSPFPFDTTGLDYRLQLMSPAIDLGNNAAVTTTLDLESGPRIVNGTVDFGAYESNYCDAMLTLSSGGPTAVCDSGATTLWVAGGDQFLWSTGVTDSLITVDSAGTYFVIAADALGCRSLLQQQFSIYPSPSPVIQHSPPNLNTGSYSIYQWYFNGNSISGATTSSTPTTGYGEYEVTVTDVHGCTGSDSYCYAAATIQASGPNPACSGDSVTLSVMGGTQFNWSTGDTAAFIVAYATGIYSVTVMDAAGGCSSVLNHPVTIYPNPVVPISYNGTYLSTSSFDTYQWYYNGLPIAGAIGNTHIPGSGNGAYLVSVTDTNGCSGSSVPYILTLGIDPISPLEMFSVYPVPMEKEGLLHLQFDPANLLLDEEQISISVMDPGGKSIWACRTKPTNIISLDLGFLPSGMYMIRVSGKDNQILRRFIVP